MRPADNPFSKPMETGAADRDRAAGSLRCLEGRDPWPRQLIHRGMGGRLELAGPDDQER